MSFYVVFGFRIDASGANFCAPVGGWADKLFTVIYQTEPTKRLMPGKRVFWGVVEYEKCGVNAGFDIFIILKRLKV